MFPLVVLNFGRESPSDTRENCFRCCEIRKFSVEKSPSAFDGFSFSCFESRSFRQRKVRVTLADFALDALEHVRDARGGWPIFDKTHSILARSKNLSGRARRTLAALGFS